MGRLRRAGDAGRQQVGLNGERLYTFEFLGGMHFAGLFGAARFLGRHVFSPFLKFPARAVASFIGKSGSKCLGERRRRCPLECRERDFVWSHSSSARLVEPARASLNNSTLTYPLLVENARPTSSIAPENPLLPRVAAGSRNVRASIPTIQVRLRTLNQSSRGNADYPAPNTRYGCAP